MEGWVKYVWIFSFGGHYLTDNLHRKHYFCSKRDEVCNPVIHVSKPLKHPNVSVGVANPDRHQGDLISKRDGVCNPVIHVSKPLKHPKVSVGVANPDRHRSLNKKIASCGVIAKRDGVYNPVTHVSKPLNSQTFQSGLQTPTGTGH